MTTFKIILLMLFDWFVFTHILGAIVVLINIVSKDCYVFNYWVALVGTTLVYMVSETLSNGWERNKKYYEQHKETE